MLPKQDRLIDCDQCLFKYLSCKYIPPEDFELIRKTSHQMKFKKGEVIYKQGSKCSSLIFLHKGIVKFNYEYPSGKNFITTIVKGPKLLGGANLFFGDTCIFSIIAVEDCEVCHIESKALKAVGMKHGNYILAICEQTLTMFQASIFNFISLAHNQVFGRIADILIYLWENIYKDSDYHFNLTRKELSEFAACSHENVINTLSKLNKEGIIQFQGKDIIIKDLEKLHSISKNG
jgi:CRP/FNR family transcriptional regulator, polysaccharide utilization system transcription regulator